MAFDSEHHICSILYRKGIQEAVCVCSFLLMLNIFIYNNFHLVFLKEEMSGLVYTVYLKRRWDLVLFTPSHVQYLHICYKDDKSGWSDLTP